MKRLYRKKPVVVEARQLGNDYDDDCEIVDWCGGRAVGEDYGDKALVAISTPEGTMIGEAGDCIIKEPFPTNDRTFYPCKPDIFEQTYELFEIVE